MWFAFTAIKSSIHWVEGRYARQPRHPDIRCKYPLRRGKVPINRFHDLPIIADDRHRPNDGLRLRGGTLSHPRPRTRGQHNTNDTDEDEESRPTQVNRSEYPRQAPS